VWKGVAGKLGSGALAIMGALISGRVSGVLFHAPSELGRDPGAGRPENTRLSDGPRQLTFSIGLLKHPGRGAHGRLDLVEKPDKCIPTVNINGQLQRGILALREA
jgi:hypothetical protein